jgi:NADH:ubiquinone oxidoreductase subunit F (NADH-binding)
VETLAGIALIARNGADWFRELGSQREPGSILVTLGGAVGRPGITELESGSPLRAALELCHGFDAEAQALLVGGYFGTWVPFKAALDAPLSEAGLRPLGAALGARSIAILPHSSCGVSETARLADYLAGESAGQCGPCVFGLRAIADALASIAACESDCAGALERLRRLAPQVDGRGACAHPNGATRLAASALAVFADEIRHHLAGHCTARSSAPVLPIPPASTEWR